MEESEKRKERLKAMRMEASQSGNYNETANNSMGSSSFGLTNPLIDSPLGKTESYVMQRPRFDYYTDPMAAFSANKRSNNNVSPQVNQQCYTPPPRPRHPQYPQSPIYAARGNNPVDQRPQSQGVHNTFNPRGNPGQNSPVGTPQIRSGYRGSPYQGSGYRGSPNQGSAHRSSPYQGSGQGRSQWRGNNSSPGSFRSGGRGRGSHGCTSSAESRPDLYYSKSMVEDPWEEMKPVIWKPLKRDWLPPSISAKKAKLPDDPVKSIPQQSLAEYLSASFNEVASSEAGNAGSGS